MVFSRGFVSHWQLGGNNTEFRLWFYFPAQVHRWNVKELPQHSCGIQAFVPSWHWNWRKRRWERDNVTASIMLLKPDSVYYFCRIPSETDNLWWDCSHCTKHQKKKICVHYVSTSPVSIKSNDTICSKCRTICCLSLHSWIFTWTRFLSTLTLKQTLLKYKFIIYMLVFMQCTQLGWICAGISLYCSCTEVTLLRDPGKRCYLSYKMKGDEGRLELK